MGRWVFNSPVQYYTKATWIVSVLAGIVLAGCEPKAKQDPPAALVNAVPILESQLLEAAQAELAEIKKQEVAVKRRVLERLITRSVIDYELKRLGQTEGQLFEAFHQKLQGETLERAKERYIDELRQRSTIHIYLKDDGTVPLPL